MQTYTSQLHHGGYQLDERVSFEGGELGGAYFDAGAVLTVVGFVTGCSRLVVQAETRHRYEVDVYRVRPAAA